MSRKAKATASSKANGAKRGAMSHIQSPSDLGPDVNFGQTPQEYSRYFQKEPEIEDFCSPTERYRLGAPHCRINRKRGLVCPLVHFKVQLVAGCVNQRSSQTLFTKSAAIHLGATNSVHC